MAKRRSCPIGTFYVGPVDPPHLIPALLTELDWNPPNSRGVRQEMRAIEGRLLGERQCNSHNCPNRRQPFHRACLHCSPGVVSMRDRKSKYLASDTVHKDIMWLTECLAEKAGPFFVLDYHPAREGEDEWGFYLSPEWETELLDDGGIKVSDLSDVPRNFTGYAAVINNHGDVTLHYFGQDGRGRQHRREMWSVV